MTVMSEDEQPVVQFILPMPMPLYGVLVRAIGEACDEVGFEAVFKEADGLGVVHVRKRPVDEQGRI